MALSDEIEEMAKKHGATSYRNRFDTQHPAYGFTPAQLENLLVEFTAQVHKRDAALIRQLVAALSLPCDRWNGTQSRIVREAIDAGRAWLEGKTCA